MGAVDEVVFLLEEAFSGEGIRETNEAQSFLTNLRSVDTSFWRALPAGGQRTIESITLHVGGAKVMYDDYAFGAGTLQWTDIAVRPWPRGFAPMDEAIAWLQTVHGTLLDHVRDLDDGALSEPRKANWGAERPTRWLLSMLMQHDTYHAGEVNHVRSLLERDDFWRWG